MVTAQRRELVVLLAPIAVLFAASVVGLALTPTLAPAHPLALLVLDARNRTLVLVAKHIEWLPFVLIAVVRRLSSDPLYYVLGRRYGERAVRWVERQFGGSVIRATEVLFRRASYAMVFLFPGALVCALAGQSGMHPVAFGALNVGGTLFMVVALRAFGTTVLADPVDTVLRFFNDHRLVTTAASVTLVVAWLVLQKLTGHGEVPSVSELEADLAADDGSGSEVEERVEADGHPGPGRDRLHREDDAG